MRRTLRRTGAFTVLAAMAVVPAALPAAAQTDGASSVTQRQSILTQLSPTGEASSSQVFTQLTVAGEGPVTVELPDQATRGLRSLDGFGGPDVDGETVRWELDATPDGTRARSVADNTTDIPVTVSISYTLDGAQVEPEDVVGATGDLEVTYTVANTTTETRDIVTFDAQNNRSTESVDVAVPMVGSLALDLPPTFTAIDAPGANVAGDGRGNTVVNFSLLLFSPLGSEEQTVSYSARISDGVVPEATIQILPVDDRSFGSLRSTAEAYGDAVDSTVELANGALILDSNVQLLAGGAAELLDGLGQLSEGANELSAGLTETAAPGARTLADGLGTARAGGSELASGLGELAVGAGALREGLGTAAVGGNTLASGLGELAAGAGALRDGLNSAEAGGADLSSGLGDLADGAGELRAGTGELAAGANQLNESTDELIDGAGQLEAGSGGLLVGLETLRSSLTGPTGLPTAIAGVDQLVAAVDGALTGIGSAAVPGTLLNGLSRISAGLSNPGCDPTNPQNPSNPCGLVQVVGLLDAGAGELDAGLVQLAGGLNNPGCDASNPGDPANPCGVRQGLAGLTGALGQLAGAIDSATGALEDIDETVLTPEDQQRLATAIGTLGPGAVDPLLAGLNGGIANIDAGVGQLLAGIGDPATADTLRNGVAQLRGGLAGIQAALGDPATAGTLRNGIAQVTGGLSNPGCDTSNPTDPGNRCGIQQVLQLIGGGLTQLDTGLNGALDGVRDGLGDRASGPTTLIGGAAQLAGGTSQLAEGAQRLQDEGTAPLAAGAGQLSAGAQQLADGAGLAANGSQDLLSGLRQLSAGGGELAAGAGTAADGSGDLVDGLGQLADGGVELAAGAGRAAEGGGDLADGLVQLDDGANQLADGLGDAADGSTQLAEGLTSAEDGGSQIADGTVRLSEVGMASLIEGVSGATQSASLSEAQVAAVTERGREYSAPYGVADGADASAVWQFEVAGVGTSEEGPSRGLLIGMAVLALGAAGALGLGLRRRLA